MNKQIEIHKNKKVNKIHNQCLTFVFIICALSTPWLLHEIKVKTKSPKAHQQYPKTQAEQNEITKPVQSPIILARKLEPLLVSAVAYEPVQSAIQPAEEEHNLVDKIKVLVKTAIETASTNPVAPIAEQTNPGLSITKTKIDSKFLAKMEGSKLKGYVPAVSKSKSGVTIGTGLDLGQLHKNEFNSLPFSASLKTKLAPYVGLKKHQALAFLNSHPLFITSQELEEIDVVAANKILLPLADRFKKSSGKAFTSLPGEAQTVIFSYAYQYGPGFDKKAKKLWHYFVAENWQKASATLRSSSQYKSRRHQEAHLLDQIA